MKKLLLILFSAILLLSACSADKSSNETAHTISPYEHTEDNKEVIHAFGLDGNSQLLTFEAPPKTSSATVTLYTLTDGAWVSDEKGGMKITLDPESESTFSGTFSMILRDDYSIDFRICENAGASYSSSFKAPQIDFTQTASLTGFLLESENIELDREIPVALMVYDEGYSLKSFALQDYFSPEKFEGMDLVRVVTLTFSSQK